MKKIVFIDRDGTLIKEPKDYQIDQVDKLDFLEGVISNLKKIQHQLGYTLVMITNQDGLGTTSFPADSFWPTHNAMLRVFESEGIFFENVFIDESLASKPSPNRKPSPAMLSGYIHEGFDRVHSFVIGDRMTDVELALNLGIQAITLNLNNKGASETKASSDALNAGIYEKTADWSTIFSALARLNRSVQHKRTTKETDIRVFLDLDRQDEGLIHTGISFFDHMLEQLAKHAQITLDLSCKGDLHIDEHHTIEDCALALGEAFKKALGNKAGIERYGYCLPMDDCLAQVAIDFGGRPWLVWEAEFKREKVGEMPTEMFYHFFKSFADASGANLHIQASGTNEHHKIEAIFKAFAKAIKMALRKDINHLQLPSTKGVL
jgi:imidazoleglycerol-phosphate dehydratase / histidinol-phosphatase